MGDDLNELIGITYINKIHLFFSSLKNFIVKLVWLKVVMKCVTFWEVSQKVCK